MGLMGGTRGGVAPSRKGGALVDCLFQLVVVVCLLLITGILVAFAWHTHRVVHDVQHAVTHSLPAFVQCTEASVREQIPDLQLPKAYTDVTSGSAPACRVLGEQVLVPMIGRNDSDTGSVRSFVKNVANDHGKVTRTLTHVESTSAQMHRLSTHLVGDERDPVHDGDDDTAVEDGDQPEGVLWPVLHEVPNLLALATDLRALATRIRAASTLIIDNLEQVAMPKMLNLSTALPTPDRVHSALQTMETTLAAANHMSRLLDSKLVSLFTVNNTLN